LPAWAALCGFAGKSEIAVSKFFGLYVPDFLESRSKKICRKFARRGLGVAPFAPRAAPCNYFNWNLLPDVFRVARPKASALVSLLIRLKANAKKNATGGRAYSSGRGSPDL
jgi:hypothetical protein